MTDDVEHGFMCLLGYLPLFWMKYVFTSFALGLDYFLVSKLEHLLLLFYLLTGGPIWKNGALVTSLSLV